MARIAKGRDRVLTREEIATETLRQFDENTEAPSIRALASALGVAPSASGHSGVARRREALNEAAQPGREELFIARRVGRGDVDRVVERGASTRL